MALKLVWTDFGKWLTLHRWRVVWTLVLVMFFFASQLKTRGDLLGACHRANGSRLATVEGYNALVLVNQRRVAAKTSTPDERAANRFAIRKYRVARRDYVVSQVGVSDDPDARFPQDRVLTDCGSAYPPPWPLNGL